VRVTSKQLLYGYMMKKDENGKTGLEGILDSLYEMSKGTLNGEKISKYKQKESLRLLKKFKRKFPVELAEIGKDYE
tara:strand:+ start:33 stop:260 length:228 start_codon:yes stop_codon:yes gene_type:complete